LQGCATGPTIVDGRLQFPEYKFSMASLPADWRIIEPKPPGAVIGWKNSVTNSLIGITARQVNPAISYEKSFADFKAAVLKGVPEGLAKRFPSSGAENISVTIEEDKDINIEGKIFHCIIFNYGGTPLKGVSISGKIVFYIIEMEGFFYTLSLNAVLGYYEKDIGVFEQIVRSFKV